MELKNCTLGRPKKLRYFPTKENSSAPTNQKMTLKNIEHLFDDLDSASDGEDDLIALCLLPKTLQAVEESEVLNGEAMLSGGMLMSNVMESEIDGSFKELRPIKASSPIDWKVDAETRDYEEEKRASSPLLLDCDEFKHQPVSHQNPNCNRLLENRSYDAKPDTPSKTSHCNNAEVKRMRIDPTRKEQLQKSDCPNATELSQKTHLTEIKSAPVVQVRKETQCSTVSQEPRSKEQTIETSKQEGKDMSVFLKKLREAAQSKPPCPRKPQSPLKSTPPTEPDDDFLILEDDEPCMFSIPRKAARYKSKNTQQQIKAPSLDRELSTDMGAKQSQQKIFNEQPKIHCANKEKPDTISHTRKGKTWMGGGVSEKPIITTAATKRCFVKKATSDPSLAKVTRPEVEENLFSCLDEPFADHLTIPGQQHNGTNKLKEDLLKATTPLRKEAKQHGNSASATSDQFKSSKTQKKACKFPGSRKAKTTDSIKENSEESKAESNQPVNKSKDEVLGLETLDNPEAFENIAKRVTDEHETYLVHCTQNVLKRDVIPDTPTKKNPPIGQQKAMLDPSLNKGPVKKTLLAGELVSHEEGQLSTKRQRRKPGTWWLSCPSASEQNNDHMDTMTSGSDEKRTGRRSTLSRAKEVPALQMSSVDSEHEGSLKDDMEMQSGFQFSQTKRRISAKSCRVKKSTKSKVKQGKYVSSEEDVQSSMAEQGNEQDQSQDLDQAQCSPLLRQLQLNTAGDKVFDRVYSHTPNRKVSCMVEPSTPKRPLEHVKTPVPFIRRTQDGLDNVESPFSPRRKPGTKKPKIHQRSELNHSKSLSLGVPKNGKTAHTSTPLNGSPRQLLNENDVSSRMTARKHPLTKLSADRSSVQKYSVKEIRGKKGGCRTLFPSQQQETAHGCLISDWSKENPDLEPADNTIVYNSRAVNRSPSLVSMESYAQCEKEKCTPSYSVEVIRRTKRLSDNTLKDFQSGPSSMIEMENSEENGDLCPPLSREVRCLMSYSELCGPPLRPLVLQDEDKVNLVEWLGLLWPSNAQNGGQSAPDQFHWYSYRRRAMGFQDDLSCTYFCNGKLLLGSFMKKPLLVDHDATSVYNILTSSVSVTINGKETHHYPGQSFLVPCGHAYSIHNMTHEPAVLYFNRMLTECTD